MSQTTRIRLWSRWRGAVAAATGVLVAMLVIGRSNALSAEPPPARNLTELVVADGGQPLFDGRPLAPGEQRQACAEVTYIGDRDDVEVRLTATVRDRGLAPFLEVKVEEGRSAVPGQCTTFVAAQTTFEGSLAELGRTEVGSWRPRPHDARDYRLTTRLEHLLPGSEAEADLRWLVRGS